MGFGAIGGGQVAFGAIGGGQVGFGAIGGGGQVGFGEIGGGQVAFGVIGGGGQVGFGAIGGGQVGFGEIGGGGHMERSNAVFSSITLCRWSQIEDTSTVISSFPKTCNAPESTPQPHLPSSVAAFSDDSAWIFPIVRSSTTPSNSDIEVQGRLSKHLERSNSSTTARTGT